MVGQAALKQGLRQTTLEPEHTVPIAEFRDGGQQSLKAAPALLEELEDIIIDIQDVGCRYFTYLTTIAYLFETLSRCAHPPRIWLIDHHNPADRQVEGTPISRKYASFIGHLV